MVSTTFYFICFFMQKLFVVIDDRNSLNFLLNGNFERKHDEHWMSVMGNSGNSGNNAL